MSESSQWPFLGKVDAVDPYPFHGLIYRVSGVEWLDPRDGRPAIEVPDTWVSLNASPHMHNYSPHQAGVLWDIGRADPPESPLIEAASGRSLGRRVMRAGGSMPVRLADKTHQIEVLLFPESTGIDLRLQVKGDSQGPIFETLTMADFGVVLENIYSEEDLNPISGTTGMRLGVNFSDATPDGVRRLYAVHLERAGVSIQPYELVPVGFFEVTLSLDEDVVVGAVDVVAQIEDCLGTYTNTGMHDYQRRSPLFPGPCALSWELVTAGEEWRPNLADAGSASRTSARFGLVTGALYIEGSIEYFTCDYTYSHDLSGSWSNPGYTGTEISPGECSYDGSSSPPAIPDTITRLETFTESITARFGGHSISGDFTVTVTAGGTGDDVTGSSAGSIMGRSYSGALPYVPTLKWLFVYPPPGGLVLPSRNRLGLNTGSPVATAALRRNRSFQGLAVAFDDDDNGAQSPMLHATGVSGAQEDLANIRRDSAFRPLYDGALCPITRNAVRACDLPADQLIQGWI